MGFKSLIAAIVAASAVMNADCTFFGQYFGGNFNNVDGNFNKVNGNFNHVFGDVNAIRGNGNGIYFNSLSSSKIKYSFILN
jgi:hypothetical protein